MSCPRPLRALSVRDPWATLIAIGAKQTETRSWPTSHRGLIAIHSSRAFGPEDRALCSLEPFRGALQQAGIRSPADIPRGAIIAVAEIAGCDPVPDVSGWERHVPAEPERSFGFYSPGRWMWRLANISMLAQPLPCRGMLGLWIPPSEALEAVAEQLARGGR